MDKDLHFDESSSLLMPHQVLSKTTVVFSIVIHCSAGIGRTGTIIACILISSGKFSADQALNLLFGLTPKIGPENEKQISIVRKYYQYHLSKKSRYE